MDVSVVDWVGGVEMGVVSKGVVGIGCLGVGCVGKVTEGVLLLTGCVFGDVFVSVVLMDGLGVVG